MQRLPVASRNLLLIVAAGATHAQHFPPLDVEHASKSRMLRGVSFCMTARNDISNPTSPLFTFDFTAPGASGAVLIDGTKIKTFKNERHLVIYADVAAGNHRFNLRLDQAAVNTRMYSHDDFKYCKPSSDIP